MKNTLLVLAVIAITSCGNNTRQPKESNNENTQCTDLQSIQLQGKVKTVKNYTYKNAILKDGNWFPSDSTTYTITTVLYNEKGFQTTQTGSSYEKGILVNTVTKTSHYNEDNTLNKQKITFKEGHTLVEYTYPSANVSQALSFNEAGKKIEKEIITKGDNCVIQSIQSYRYDTTGKLLYALQTNFINQQGVLMQERTIIINEDGSQSKDDTSTIIYNIKEIHRDKYNPTTLIIIPENNIEGVKLTKIEHTYY